MRRVRRAGAEPAHLRRRGALAAAALAAAAALTGAPTASAAGTTIRVDPQSGKDTNPGTAAAPVKGRSAAGCSS